MNVKLREVRPNGVDAINKDFQNRSAINYFKTIHSRKKKPLLPKRFLNVEPVYTDFQKHPEPDCLNFPFNKFNNLVTACTHIKQLQLPFFRIDASTFVAQF